MHTLQEVIPKDPEARVIIDVINEKKMQFLHMCQLASLDVDFYHT